MICFRCKKEIMINDNYLIFVEMKNEKEVTRDFAHKTCWNEFLNSMKDITEAKGMIHGLGNYFKKIGVLPKDEVVIQ